MSAATTMGYSTFSDKDLDSCLKQDTSERNNLNLFKQGILREDAIELSLQPRHECVERWLVGATATRRWHCATAQLAHDLFPHLGLVGDAGNIDGVEGEPGSLKPFVVTGDAVAIEHRAVARRGRGCGSLAGRFSGHA